MATASGKAPKARTKAATKGAAKKTKTKKTAVKKPANKSSATKKAAVKAKKPANRKPAAKAKVTAKKPATKAKAAAKKPVAKKPAAKAKTAAKKPAAKKPATKAKAAAKKPAAKKPATKAKAAAKKPAAKKQAAKVKTVAKKPATKAKAAAKKPATKAKAAAKKPAAKAKKPATKVKAAAKKPATKAKKPATKVKAAAKKPATKAKAVTKKPAAKVKAPGKNPATKAKAAVKQTSVARPATKKAAKADAPTKKVAAKTKAAPAEPEVSSATAPTEAEVRFARGEAKRVELAKRVAQDEAIEVDELFEVARDIMGIESLRPGQREALEHVLAGEDVLAVMPTGSGKSLLYQLPSLVLPGITVVISPLIALIKDQIDKMKAWGVAVCRIDSTLTVKQKREMEALIKAPGGKLLLTTPERMSVPEFREFLKESAQGVGVSLFVVDEAHCASQWGHDFRPSYLALRKAIEDLGSPPILAATATAPPHVRDDICHQLDIEDAQVVTTTFDRPNLHFEVIATPGDDDKNKTLITLLKKLPTPGIVYCATVKMVNSLHEKLYRHGIPVVKYHGRLTKKERDNNQQEFMSRRDLVMIATNAFGLGIDKSNIRNVLHYHVPGSLESYAQEAGRGGRDRKPARCVLLFSPDDVAIQEFFLRGSYPTRRQVRAVFTALKAWTPQEESEPSSSNIALAARTGTSRTKTVLNLLKDESFIVEDEAGLFKLSSPPPDEGKLYEKAKQYEGRRIADRQRLDALLAYVGTPDCRNQMILSYLGEDDPPECGRCDNCLRSKEAARQAAREASKLEDGVLRVLREDDDDDDLHMPRTQTLVRTRVVRIDKRGADEAKSAGQAQPTAGPAGVFEYVEDEDENDEDYDYFDEEEVHEIEHTAAALAAEGYSPEEIEITILARKKAPKPPRKSKRAGNEAEPAQKKKRRRRRKKTNLPKKGAFSSPVLTKEVKTQKSKSSGGRRKKSAPAGPLVEYVRGPLRLNMAPVASAAPSDTNKQQRRPKPKRRRPTARKTTDINAGSVIATAKPEEQTPQAQVSASGGKKRKRRRRKKKKSQNGDVNAAANNQAGQSDAPVDFFSSGTAKLTPTGIPQGAGKKKRRRRRRRGKGRGGAGSDGPQPESTGSAGE